MEWFPEGGVIVVDKQQIAQRRKMRREELARDLLLKLVESTPGSIKYDTKFNVAKAIEYTDALLIELEKNDGPTDK